MHVSRQGIAKRENVFKLIEALKKSFGSKMSVEFYDAKIPFSLAVKNLNITSRSNQEKANLIVVNLNNKKALEIALTGHRGVFLRIYDENLGKDEVSAIESNASVVGSSEGVVVSPSFPLLDRISYWVILICTPFMFLIGIAFLLMGGLHNFMMGLGVMAFCAMMIGYARRLRKSPFR